MPHLTNEFETEEVREYLRNVIDDRRDAEKRRRSTVILNSGCGYFRTLSIILASIRWRYFTHLQVPKQKREYQSNTESHEPRYEQKRSALQVGKIFQNRYPFWDFLRCLSEDFSLKYNIIMCN